MSLEHILSLSAGKQQHPGITPPDKLDYYLSAEEYNTLISGLKEWITEYKSKLVNLDGPINLPILSSDSTSNPTDTNIFSSSRTLKEINKLGAAVYSDFLSKKNDDTALGKVTFKKGINFRDNLNVETGYINSSGDAFFKSLKLSEFLEVPELKYNRVEIQTGDKWRSPGGGVIENVTIISPTTGQVTLKLENQEYGAISVNDLCVGIFHSINSPNSTITADTPSERKMEGFATSYFKVLTVDSDSKNKIFTYELRPGYTVHPEKFMNFAVFGNTTNSSRQASVLETRTYQRFLKGVNNWEINYQNIAAQFGDLSNLAQFSPHLSQMEGYSIYLNNVYFSGTIQQLKAPKIINNYWWEWNPNANNGEGGYVNTWISATKEGKSGIYAITDNENVIHVLNSEDTSNWWFKMQVFEGDTVLTWEPLNTDPSGNGKYIVKTITNNTDFYVDSYNTSDLTTYSIDGFDGSLTRDTAITYQITGKRLSGESFSFTKTQNFHLVTDGKDGEGVEYVYKRSGVDGGGVESAVTDIPTYATYPYQNGFNSWYQDPQGTSLTNPTEYVSQRRKVDGIWSLFSAPAVFSNFSKDGNEIQYIYTRNDNEFYNVTPSSSQDDDYIPSGWYTPAKGVTRQTGQTFEWRSERKKVKGIWSDFSAPALQARYARDGAIGPSGTGIPIVYRGLWDIEKEYYGSSSRVDIVKHNNYYFRSTPSAGTFSGLEPSLGGPSQWEPFGAQFESVATNLLYADTAWIAGFAFDNNILKSQLGNAPNFPGLFDFADADTPEKKADFIPNLQLDGVLGRIKLGNSIELNGQDGTGYLANGAISWDSTKLSVNSGEIGGFHLIEGKLFSNKGKLGTYEELYNDLTEHQKMDFVPYLTLDGNTGIINSENGIFVNGTFKGNITADSGKIGNFTIDSNKNFTTGYNYSIQRSPGEWFTYQGVTNMNDNSYNISGKSFNEMTPQLFSSGSINIDYGGIQIKNKGLVENERITKLLGGSVRLYMEHETEFIETYISNAELELNNTFTNQRVRFSTIENQNNLTIVLRGLPTSGSIMGQVYRDTNGFLKIKL